VAASLFLNRLSLAQDENTDWESALKEAIRNKSPITLGHCLPPPTDPSWKEAHAILDGAPKNVTPYEIAMYFIDSVPPKYQQAWPEPDFQHCTDANPVVVMFFLATNRKPDCDPFAVSCNAVCSF